MTKAARERIKFKREVRARWIKMDPVLRWQLRSELKTRRPFRHDLEKLAQARQTAYDLEKLARQTS